MKLKKLLNESTLEEPDDVEESEKRTKDIKSNKDVLDLFKKKEDIGDKKKKVIAKKRPTFKEEVEFYLDEGILNTFKSLKDITTPKLVQRTTSNQMGEFYTTLDNSISKNSPIRVAKVNLKASDGFKVDRAVKIFKKVYYFPFSTFKLKVEPRFKGYKNIQFAASVDTDEE
jgi:hypothetical protein